MDIECPGCGAVVVYQSLGRGGFGVQSLRGLPEYLRRLGWIRSAESRRWYCSHDCRQLTAQRRTDEGSAN